MHRQRITRMKRLAIMLAGLVLSSAALADPLPLSINVGNNPNDRTGDGLRTAFTKTMQAVNSLNSMRGQAGGLATLDGAGRLIGGQMPLSLTPAFVGLTQVGDINLSLAGTKNPNAILFGAGNRISFCPALSCLAGPPDGSINPAYFDHQRTSLLVSAETQDDAHSEEQTLAVMTTVSKGYLKDYAANTAYSVGDNVARGNAVYRATKAGTTGANSAPPALPASPSSLPLIVNDGSVTWQWINAAAIAAKVGIYNEIEARGGGGNTWAQANNLQLQPGYIPRFVTNTELDITNNSGRDCEIGVSCLGLLFGISGQNKVTAAISVTRHNPAGTGAIWGMRFENKNLASESAVAVDSGSKYGISANSLPGLLDLGFGSDNQFQSAFIYDNSTSPYGIQIAGTKSAAQIIGNNWYVDPSGRGYFSGLTATGSIVESQSRTPASASASCVTGERSWDANFEYRCVAANTWKRAALSGW